MQLGSTKIQKPASCRSVFHKSFPYSLSLCGLDLGSCYTQCANVQAKPNASPAQKHSLLCGKRQARHTLSTFHIADPRFLQLHCFLIKLMSIRADYV